MIRIQTARLLAATPLVALLAACGGESADTPEAPAGDAPGEIAERQDNFEGIKDGFMAIREQLEADAPDFGVIEASAADIRSRADAIPNLFPEGSGRDAGFDTEALATIWERGDEFTAAHALFVERADAMVEAAASGDAAAVGAQVGELGGSCKNCHDNFRLDTD